jgi:hypothetical protein
MKSIYYNWIKSRTCPDNHTFSKTEEEMWGQFIDLETNNFYNNQHKTFPYYTNTKTNTKTNTTTKTLVKYEPSLFTIQENIQSNTIIFDATPSPFIMSMSLLGCYTLVRLFLQFFMAYNSNPA